MQKLFSLAPSSFGSRLSISCLGLQSAYIIYWQHELHGPQIQANWLTWASQSKGQGAREGDKGEQETGADETVNETGRTIMQNCFAVGHTSATTTKPTTNENCSTDKQTHTHMETGL